MTQEHDERANLSCTAKCGVLSELLKRNLDAMFTAVPTSVVNGMQDSGEMRITERMQIGVKYDNIIKNIKVRAYTRANNFITNYYQVFSNPANEHPDYWVFVRIDERQNFHYYILTHDELGRVQRDRNDEYLRNHPEANIPIGVDNVQLRHVAEYEDRWDTIVNCE